jgi:hypothetical protein
MRKRDKKMIFESLYASALMGELLLVEGGMCRWHRRRDGTITIYEIISQKPGAGQAMLALLVAQRPVAIVAKCPIDLPSNAWYARRGFLLDRVETTPSGRNLNVWRLTIGNHPE